MDGGEGTSLTLYKCTLSSTVNASVTNVHGATGATVPVTVIFSNCVMDGDYGYTPLTTESGVVDELWAIGNTGAGALTSSSGTHLNVHTSGTPPYPANGLSTYQQGYYLPASAHTPHTQTFGAADQAAFSPPVGRSYYVHVVPTKSIHTTHAGVMAAANGGVVGVRRHRDAVPPADVGTATVTLVTGENDVQASYYDTYYPGETAHLWVQVDIVSGAPSLQGSLALASGSYYSDDGGTTISPVPGGTRVPVVVLKSAT
jgi:hypothetical protein